MSKLNSAIYIRTKFKFIYCSSEAIIIRNLLIFSMVLLVIARWLLRIFWLIEQTYAIEFHVELAAKATENWHNWLIYFVGLAVKRVGVVANRSKFGCTQHPTRLLQGPSFTYVLKLYIYCLIDVLLTFNTVNIRKCRKVLSTIFML